MPIDEQIEKLMPRSIRVDVTLSPTATGFEVNLQDLSGISRDLERVETSLMQFFDIATSQRIMFPEE